MGSSGSVMKDTAVAVHNDQVAPGDGEVDIKLKHGPDAMDVTTATRSSYMIKTTVETFATRLHASDKFKEIDADGNGFLEKEELDQVAKYVLERCIIHNEEFGIKANKIVMMETKNRIMERVDVNGDGKMDEDEFCDLCEMISSRFLIIARAKEKFDEFDVDGSGEIDKTECIKVMEWALEMNAYVGQHSVRSNTEKKTYKDRLIHQLKSFQLAGKMEFAEFGRIFEELLIQLELVESAKRKFEELDIDSSGQLEVAEIDLLLESISLNFRAKDMKQRKKFRESFLRNVDENHDGKLTLMEFVYLWENICARLDLINQYHILFSKMTNFELSPEELNKIAVDIEEMVKIWFKTCRYGSGENLLAEIPDVKLESFMKKIMNTQKRERRASTKSSDFTKNITYRDPNDYVPTTAEEEAAELEIQNRNGTIIAENLYNFVWHNDSKAQKANEDVKLATASKAMIE